MSYDPWLTVCPLQCPQRGLVVSRDIYNLYYRNIQASWGVTWEWQCLAVALPIYSPRGTNKKGYKKKVFQRSDYQKLDEETARYLKTSNSKQEKREGGKLHHFLVAELHEVEFWPLAGPDTKRTIPRINLLKSCSRVELWNFSLQI